MCLSRGASCCAATNRSLGRETLERFARRFDLEGAPAAFATPVAARPCSSQRLAPSRHPKWQLSSISWTQPHSAMVDETDVGRVGKAVLLVRLLPTESSDGMAWRPQGHPLCPYPVIPACQLAPPSHRSGAKGCCATPVHAARSVAGRCPHHINEISLPKFFPAEIPLDSVQAPAEGRAVAS
jgi:hypothetical protein